jgi:hypothetical protein
MNEDDDDLPVLTQILRTGDAHPSDAPIDRVRGPIGNEPHHEIASYQVPPFDLPVTEDPAAFAAQVRDAVLENVSGRIDTELDARIAQAIHAEVETALARLQGSLRAQLSEAFKDVVGRAVDEEIARLAAVRSSGSG